MGKEKRKLFIYMVSTFVVVSIVVFSIIIYNKVFVIKYDVGDISFEYYSNFKVRKKDDKLFINSKDDEAKINVTVEVAEDNYVSSNYEIISNDVMKRIVDESKYEVLTNDCSDHMCIRTYSDKKSKKQVVVEFRENILITYLFECNGNKFDQYIEGFELVVNSFVKDNDRVE